MKYDTEHDEHVSEMIGDGMADTDGDVEAPVGWFAAVTLDDTEDSPDLAALEHYGTPWLLARENSQGFFTVIPFPTIEARNQAYAQLEQDYLLWDAGITEQDIVAAIDGYRTCALWSTDVVDENGNAVRSFDQVNAGLTPSAQRQMRDDVVLFAVGNVDAIRSFLAVTGLDWGQVGHDFWLTRNRHGAGFWDRGAAGEAVESLVQSSRDFGGCDLYLNDDGEIEVS